VLVSTHMCGLRLAASVDRITHLDEEWAGGWRLCHSARLYRLANILLVRLPVAVKSTSRLLPMPHEISLSVYPPTHLQHMQQGCLSRIIQTEEEELSMLVEQAKRCQSIPDYPANNTVSVLSLRHRNPTFPWLERQIPLTPVDDPHRGGWV
jgi:hypothetical protein